MCVIRMTYVLFEDLSFLYVRNTTYNTNLKVSVYCILNHTMLYIDRDLRSFALATYKASSYSM